MLQAAGEGSDIDIESLEKPLWRGGKNAQCQYLSIDKKPGYFFRTPS
jgi:hypothetical protein